MIQKQKTLTICIPTYNRKNLLIRLLENIEKNCSFYNQIEVLVVDDGSNDGTQNHIRKSLYNYSFELKYFKKENGGKLSAVMLGLEHSSGKYFMNMDSDDLFIPSGIDLIINTLALFEEKIKTMNQQEPIVGIVGLAYNTNNKIIGSYFPADFFISNFVKIRADFHVRGDKKEIILTNILKKLKINFHNNEKRLPPSIIWLKLSSFSNVAFINTPFIIKSYMASGISKNNFLKTRVQSPNSSADVYREILELNRYSSLLYRFKASINYWRFYFHGATKQNILFKNCLYRYFHNSAIPLGFLYYLFDKILLRLK